MEEKGIVLPELSCPTAAELPPPELPGCFTPIHKLERGQMLLFPWIQRAKGLCYERIYVTKTGR